MNHTILVILAGLLMSCASRQPTGTQPPPSPPKQSQSNRHDYLEATDLKRVRNPEFIKTYHVGRQPTRNGQLMHEAHRVYKLEKSPRWNLRRNNPTLQSTGPVGALRDAAFRPLPPSNQLRAEKRRQRELTEDLKQAHQQTVDQLEAMKARAGVQEGNAKLITRLTTELKSEREGRHRLEAQLKAQPTTSNEPSNDPGTNTKALEAWGTEQQP